MGGHGAAQVASLPGCCAAERVGAELTHPVLLHLCKKQTAPLTTCGKLQAAPRRVLCRSWRWG